MLAEPELIVPLAVEDELWVPETVPLVDRLPVALVPLPVALPESALLDVPPLAPLNDTLPTAMSLLCGGAGNTWPSRPDEVDEVLIIELVLLAMPVLRLPLLLVLMEPLALLAPIAQLAVPVDAAW